MKRVNIPISKESDSITFGAILGMLGGIFVLGLLVGIFATQFSIIPNSVTPTQNIAGAGNAILETNFQNIPMNATEVEQVGFNQINTVNSESVVLGAADSFVNTPLLLEENFIESETTDIGVAPVVPLNSEERETTIERLSREIVRIKNTSVEIIALFNQNCGTWTDSCATEYSVLLEKNNGAYERAAKELSLINGDR